MRVMQGSGRRAPIPGRPGDPRYIQAQLFRWRRLFWLGIGVAVVGYYVGGWVGKLI